MSLVKGKIDDFGAPVLAVCGFSGSGKTTLLEAAIPKLVERGLAIAVVKHDAHGFEVDRAGKDSDRLFRAGATIMLGSAQQQFERRGERALLSLESALVRLSLDHDLVLVEGHKNTPLPKVWVGNAESMDAPEGVTNIVATLAWDGDRLTAFMEYIDRWLPVAWNARPIYGGLLVGGMSSRMGSPKQLLRFGGLTLGEIAARALRSVGGNRTVALGAGVLPQSLASIAQLPDAPGFGGPGAGLLTAHRWAPEAVWVVAACDHPWLRASHIEWLVSQRRPGRWAVIPKQRDGHPCPTLALYEPQALEAMERIAWEDGEHNARPSVLLGMDHTAVLEPPAELADGWTNVNTLKALREEEARLDNRDGNEMELNGKPV